MREMFAVGVPLVYEGGLLLRMTQDTTVGGMRIPLAESCLASIRENS